MAYDVTGKQRMVAARIVRHLLRSAASRRRSGARRQSAWGIEHHHRPVRPAAEPRHRRPDHHQPAGDHGLPVRRQAADVDPVQRGRADAAAVGDVARRARTSASAAGTISSRGTSTRSTSGRRSCDSTQDRTLAASTTPGATSYAATNPDLVRGYRGYSSMASTSRFYEGWRTYHSIQFSVNRRFRDGLQFGFNDTIHAVRRRPRRAALRSPGRTDRSSAAPTRPRRRSCSAIRALHSLRSTPMRPSRCTS